jgi:hypothetical protein
MAGVRRSASAVYRVVITLTALAGVVQIFLAGRGVFGVRGGASLDHQTSLDPHRTLGDIIGIAAIVLFVLALLMLNRRLIVWTLVLVVLTEAVQRATSTPKHPWVAGLHPVSGVAIVAILGSLTGAAWRSHRTAAAGSDG